MLYINNNVTISWKELFQIAHITDMYYGLSCHIVQIYFDFNALHGLCSNTAQVLILEPKVVF